MRKDLSRLSGGSLRGSDEVERRLSPGDLTKRRNEDGVIKRGGEVMSEEDLFDEEDERKYQDEGAEA